MQRDVELGFHDCPTDVARLFRGATLHVSDFHRSENDSGAGDLTLRARDTEWSFRGGVVDAFLLQPRSGDRMGSTSSGFGAVGKEFHLSVGSDTLVSLAVDGSGVPPGTYDARIVLGVISVRDSSESSGPRASSESAGCTVTITKPGVVLS